MNLSEKMPVYLAESYGYWQGDKYCIFGTWKICRDEPQTEMTSETSSKQSHEYKQIHQDDR